MDWYKHDISAYQRATEHLTPLQDGLYRRLLDAYYQREGALTSSFPVICRLVGATTRTEKRHLVVILRAYFVHENGRYINSRADQELQEYQRLKDAGRNAARMRWAMPTQCLNKQTYIHKEEKPVDKSIETCEFCNKPAHHWTTLGSRPRCEDHWKM